MLKKLATTFLFIPYFALSQDAQDYYSQKAAEFGVDGSKLYAIVLAESGVNNEYGHYLPYPWSVTVEGRYYQFKSRTELFNYLYSNRKKQHIRYGVSGRPLMPVSRQTLWDSLSVANNINYIAAFLKSSVCKGLSDCIADYRSTQGRNQFQLISIGTHKQRIPSVQPTAHLSKIISQVSKQQGVDAALIHAIIARESAYKVYAKSHAGAMGLMQLMPGTARYLGLKPSEFYDPYKNIDAGTRYIKEQLQSFGGRLDLALAAYNAGPGAIRKYNGIPPYKETRKYVPIVIGYYQYFKKVLG